MPLVGRWTLPRQIYHAIHNDPSASLKVRLFLPPLLRQRFPCSPLDHHWTVQVFIVVA